jgi:hypothetical protein
MNYDKYKNDGWGLSKMALIKIKEVLASMNKSSINIIEFGSGKSTEFLRDLNKETDVDLLITTFDNDTKYAFKTKDGDNVNLIMRDLVECTDSDHNSMFANKTFNRLAMKPKTSKLTTRQKNNFYNVQDGDIQGVYDLMILDGPNGNGRDISFLHMKEHLIKDSFVFIDDYTHYDFVDKFLTIFDGELVFADDDKYVIYKVK